MGFSEQGDLWPKVGWVVWFFGVMEGLRYAQQKSAVDMRAGLHRGFMFRSMCSCG